MNSVMLFSTFNMLLKLYNVAFCKLMWPSVNYLKAIAY